MKKIHTILNTYPEILLPNARENEILGQGFKECEETLRCPPLKGLEENHATFLTSMETGGRKIWNLIHEMFLIRKMN